LSHKSLSKTRWRITPNQITIYPYGLSYILAAVMAVIFASGYLVYVFYLQSPLSSSAPLLITLLAVLVLFVGWAGTSVEFDVSSGVMRKKLFGLIPVSSIPFSHIYGINPVSNMMGGYKYCFFKKENRYGKGLLVSCSYGKNDDPNAIAFFDEVITPIHRLLEAYDGPEDFKPQVIEEYRFFKVEGESYIIKKNKIANVFFGLILLGIGIHELTPYAWLGEGLSLGRICFFLFTFIGGPAIALAGLTQVTLKRNSRLLTRKNPMGLGNKTYSFDDFIGVQTVRKSTNFIYTGTDVQMYFIKPQTDKQEVIVLQSFFRPKNIERFITELNSIIL